MGKILTLEEAISYFGVNSKEAIYNRARIGKSLKKIEIDNKIFYEVLIEKSTNATNKKSSTNTNITNTAENITDISKLKEEIASLKAKLEGKDELIEELRVSKKEIIEAKNFQIAEKEKQIELLGGAYNELKGMMKLLKESNESITPTEKKQTTPKQESKEEFINLTEYLQQKGYDTNTRKKIKARFSKKVGSRGITKNEKGEYLLNPKENYEDIINPWFWQKMKNLF